jgi:hypothetical protein
MKFDGQLPQDNDPADYFDERDEVVLDALALGRTHAEAAALVGLNPKWVQRRMSDDGFRIEARRRRAAHLDAVSGQLAEIGPRAVSVLLEAMAADVEMSIRVRAAIAALDTITKMGRQTDIEQRLANVEAKSFRAGRVRGVRRSS